MFYYIKKIIGYIRSLRLIPHIILFYASKDRALLEYERDSWLRSHHLKSTGLRGFLLLLNSLPEYRSLFYFRTDQNWLSVFAKGQNNLEFYTPSEKIGKGLVIWHGFSTVINVESMGEDCQVWQNVTIGKSSTGGAKNRPTIGNRVRVSAGAIAIGEICIGDDAVIGAGAVAVKDVPAGNLVVSQSSRYICKK